MPWMGPDEMNGGIGDIPYAPSLEKPKRMDWVDGEESSSLGDPPFSPTDSRKIHRDFQKRFPPKGKKKA